MKVFTNAKGSIISGRFKLMGTGQGAGRRYDECGGQPSGSFVESVQGEIGWMYDVALYDDHLIINTDMKKDKLPTKLDYSQITDVLYGLQMNVVDPSKAAVGGRVAGAYLAFGVVGAVAAATNEDNFKKTIKKKYVFIISYTASDGNESYIAFADTRNQHGIKVAKKLKELCHMPNEPFAYLKGHGNIKRIV